MVCGVGDGAAALAGEGVVKGLCAQKSGNALCLHLGLGVCAFSSTSSLQQGISAKRVCCAYMQVFT